MRSERAVAAELEVATWSKTLGAEAAYYWERHQPRYRYFLRLLKGLMGSRQLRRVLDVGMGFQTVLMDRFLEDAEIACLGVSEDARFRPSKPSVFYSIDLNRVSAETGVGGDGYDLVVCMEVLEHLYNPPDVVLRYLSRFLRTGGVLVVTTPNAVWFKNRLKMVLGRNPFEKLRRDRIEMGHIREYTMDELQDAISAANLRCVHAERCGLYRFDNAKDNCWSWMADFSHPSLRRTLVAIAEA